MSGLSMDELTELLIDTVPAVLSALRHRDVEEDRWRCERSLYHYLQSAWPYFDPAQFVGGWHAEAICEHLEAVSRGQIKRLLINIPPRHCFVPEQVIQTVVGPLPIGEIVEQRMLLHVPSWNGSNVELQPITGWHRNPGADIYRLAFDNGTAIVCTGDHHLLVADGQWLAVRDVPIGASVPVISSPNSFGRLAPIQALSDVMNVRDVNAVSGGKNLPGLCASAYFSGLFGCQLRHRALEIKSCAVSEVIKSIVQSVTVEMAGLMAEGSFADEGFRDKLMNGPMFSFGNSVTSQTDRTISSRVDLELKQPSFSAVSHAIAPDLDMCETANAPVGRNLIPREAWHLAPNFVRLVAVEHVGYSPKTYCLTVRDNHNFFAGEGQSIIVSNCKTSIVSIAWPTWTWARDSDPLHPLLGPGVRFLCASYGANKAQQDGVTARRLIGSDWYQERWGSRVRIAKDRDNQEQYDTSHGGSRISTGIPESLGKGGMVRIIDDPHKTDEVESQAVIEGQIRAYNEVWRTRANDPNQGAEVIIMQRLGESDLSGYLLENEAEDIVHLCLPAEFESDRRCVTVLGFEDPREDDGEPLWPERFDSDWCEIQKQRVGRYAWAGQYQQIPAPRGGGIVLREHWKLWPPEEEADKWTHEIEGRTMYRFPPWECVIAYLDTAFGEKDENAYSALVRWGVFADSAGRPKVMLASAWQDRLPLRELANKVLETCRRGSVDTLVIENRAGAEWVKQELQRLMRDGEFVIVLDEPRGDKVARLHSVSVLFEDGMVYAPDRSWADLVIDQVSSFPKGKFKDLTDCCSGGLGYLRRSGLIRLSAEYDADERDLRTWRGNRETAADRYGV